MKLVKGVYENIISEQVSKDIEEAQDEGLICKKMILTLPNLHQY